MSDFWVWTEPAGSFIRKTQSPSSLILKNFFSSDQNPASKLNATILSIQNKALPNYLTSLRVTSGQQRPGRPQVKDILNMCDESVRAKKSYI